MTGLVGGDVIVGGGGCGEGHWVSYVGLEGDRGLSLVALQVEGGLPP